MPIKSVASPVRKAIYVVLVETLVKNEIAKAIDAASIVKEVVWIRSYVKFLNLFFE